LRRRMSSSSDGSSAIEMSRISRSRTPRMVRREPHFSSNSCIQGKSGTVVQAH
jgi:hypothetical protein